jgi:hypothetical protein
MCYFRAALAPLYSSWYECFMTKGARMTVGQKSSISAADGWAAHIKQELAAFEQRELMFLARERDDRLRELANRLQVDLAAMNDRNCAG